MAKGNNALLIFDFDQSITNGHMHNTFSPGHDYNSAAEDAVTDADIRKFLQNKGGIKNEEKLKSVLQSAISNGIEVNIASFTGYPNAVKRVVKNHLGLSEKQAENISVFGGFPQDYDPQLKGLNIEKQQYQVGKNLHICKAIVKYKGKHGQLPKTVMLVDDTEINIKNIEKFVELMSEREGWLKENGLNIKDINNIEFKGVRVPKEKNSRIVEGVDYLKKVQEFISANLVQEPIYENLKKEEPIYQNLQKQLSEEKSPSFKSENSNVEAKPPLPTKKRKLNKVHIDNRIAANGKNEKQISNNIRLNEEQILNFMNSSKEMIEAVLPYSQSLDLESHMEKLSKSLKKNGFSGEANHAICSLFEDKVIEAIMDQGDIVTKSGKNLRINSSFDRKIDKKIVKDSLTQIMAQVQEKKKEIKDLANNCKGEDEQLRKEISKLLNINPQETDINSNDVTINQSEGQQAAASPRRYIKVTQDKNIGSNPTGTDKREKGKKTDLGSKILNYVPWRTALTLAAFAIPVAGPIAGTAVGTFLYGNYRNNNRTENSAATKENKAESAKPSLTKEFLFRAGTIAIGFLFGGPIGAAIALGIVAVDVISNGKLIQGAEKVLDAGYDALSAVGGKMLNVGKTAFSKIKETQELSKRDIEVSDPNHSSKSHVTSEGEPKAKSQVEAELKRRANAASQEQSVGR